MYRISWRIRRRYNSFVYYRRCIVLGNSESTKHWHTGGVLELLNFVSGACEGVVDVTYHINSSAQRVMGTQPREMSPPCR